MKEIEELKARALEIRKELQEGRNTADRVGSLLYDIIDYDDSHDSAVDEDIKDLQALYVNLIQSGVEIIKPTDTWPVANPTKNIIYRVTDRGNTPPQYYSDYMWNGAEMLLMAKYNNALDPRPKKGSGNLVTSGGIFDNMGALDVSELNSTENPHTLATYASLSVALDAIPTDYCKGGMSIKFVQSSDNKYVQYRLMKNTWSVIPFDWESTEDIQNRVNISELELLTPYETLEGYRIAYDSGAIDAHVVSASFGTIFKYNVVAGKTYTFDVYQSGLTWGVVWWLNSNDEFIGLDYVGSASVDNWKNKPIIAPLNAAKVWFNIQTVNIEHHKFKLVGDVILSDSLKEQIEQNTSDVAELLQKLTDTELNILTPFETLVGKRIAADDPYGTNPQIRDMASMSVRKYNVQTSGNYAFSAYLTKDYSFYVLFWFDSNGNHLRTDYQGTLDQIDEWADQPVVAPENASQMWMNILNDYSDKNNFKSVSTSLIDVDDLKEQVEQNTSDIDILMSSSKKLMKVVINEFEGGAESMPFYIRTKYNTEKDIILTHRINSNGLLTFRETFIGPKLLQDSEIMTNAYLVSSHADSTGPLYQAEQYWHLFAQHGYPVPYINNTNGMTQEDVGAEWKDQLDRHYTIGYVTSSRIWLLPVIYKDAGNHWVRDWKTPNSTPISAISHVSGGTHTSPISSVSGYANIQLFPITKHEDRKWIVDKNVITQAGTYYCDDFKVCEKQIGFDPATISNWFGGDRGTVDLTGALPMAEFTYSFNYVGAQCCVNTTIQIQREIQFGGYGGTQQQFFFDNGNYKAMFMIPKVTPQGGVNVEKPFNSPNASYQSFSIRNDVTDVNNPPERIIGFLHNPNDGKYLIGMAVGLSLISGDTIPVKRRISCPNGSLLLSFSPSNTNKFYVMALNNTPFAEQGGYFPNTFFKEVNYYVSYFDPAENVGQVYWYKDGSRYVIYCHCQSVLNRLAVNVPEIMEGLCLSVVEKTDNTELLSDTIANGKFFVNYNTNDANYIVLIAE